MRHIKQKITFAMLVLLALTAISCKKNDPKNNAEIKQEETKKSGIFTIDGKSYTGTTSIQTFVNDNYSILCTQNDPFEFLQITFHSKEEAEKGGTFDVGDDVINTAKSEVSISIGGLTYENDGKFSINVVNKKITVNNVKLTQTGGGSMKKTINSASIDF